MNWANTTWVALLLAALAMSCVETVDTSSLPPIDDYASWHRIDLTGDIPGHGDTYRIIYVNDVARTYAHVGPYPLGSVIVKEIREKAGGDSGPLKYLAVMRRLDEAALPVDLDEGWLFTDLGKLGGDEIHVRTCWKNCHVQAPYVGTWFDYGED